MLIYIQDKDATSLKAGEGLKCAGPGFWCVSLTQDVNMAVLNIVDALLDGLVTAHI